MMTCRKLAEMLIDFVSGELEPEDCSLIEEHLVACGPCEAFVHSYKVTITITRQLPARPYRQEFAERLEKMLQEIERES